MMTVRFDIKLLFLVRLNALNVCQCGQCSVGLHYCLFVFFLMEIFVFIVFPGKAALYCSIMEEVIKIKAMSLRHLVTQSESFPLSLKRPRAIIGDQCTSSLG